MNNLYKKKILLFVLCLFIKIIMNKIFKTHLLNKFNYCLPNLINKYEQNFNKYKKLKPFIITNKIVYRNLNLT